MFGSFSSWKGVWQPASDMMLEKEMRILPLIDSKKRKTLNLAWTFEIFVFKTHLTDKLVPIRTHLFHQGHTT